jgi:filamentous hemagglutinin family protein
MKSFAIALTGTLLYFSFPVGIDAQVIPDGSLPAPSIVNESGTTTEITGGTTRGTNLFHSFQRFSVPNGASVLFNNAPSIGNIFTRVTGNSASLINGTIGANGSANLFLINPSGIIFGSNARLAIGGSFVATTARSIEFADGSRWNATPTDRDNLLTIFGPVGLNFDNTPAEISIRNTGSRLSRVRPGLAPDLVSRPLVPGLQVAPDRVLAIVGGNISLDGGVITSVDSHVHIGSVRAGTVRFSPDRPGWNFDYGSVNSLGPVTLSNLSLVNAFGQRAGGIEVRGNDISLRSGSVIGAQNTGNAAQGLTLEAARTLSIEGTGVNANGPRLGTVRSAIFSETIGNGNGAGISIRAGNLNIENGGLIGSSTFGAGRAGDIAISADTIRLREIASFGGFSGIATQTVGSGAGGNVIISTGDLSVENGGGLGTTGYTAAPSGDLTIRATRSVRVTGSSASTRSPTGSNIISLAIGRGKSGDINIATPALSITAGGSVGSSTFGEGAGGNVNIDARSIELIDRPGSPLGNSLSASTLGAGNAGNLTIRTETLRVLNGSGIQSSTFAAGNGGRISIDATSIEVGSNSAIESGALTIGSPELAEFYNINVPPTGRSGDVSIRSDSLSVTGNSRVSVINLGSNDAGSIGIDTVALSLTDGGSLTASTLNGEGGNIVVRSRDSFLSNGNITASVAGTGNGGNITLNSLTLLVLDDSRIQANASAGNGGNIVITGRGILRDASSSITADSALGIRGTVNISATEENPRSLLTFDIALAVPADLVTGACLDPDRAPSTLQIVPPPLAPGPDAPLPFIFGARPETGREGSLPANRIAIAPDGRVTAVLALDRDRVGSGDCPR